MTKLHYEESVGFALKQIETYQAEIKRTQAQYIESNRVFNDGDKIVITTPSAPYWAGLGIFAGDKPTGMTEEKKRFAFVIGAEVSHKNEVQYILKTCKKDGTQGLNRDSYSVRDILTKA